MAGLGYKAFTGGAVLTAAQVQGYLQYQAVMKFATAAARDAALPNQIAEVGAALQPVRRSRGGPRERPGRLLEGDRKSTRLNSSHE